MEVLDIYEVLETGDKLEVSLVVEDSAGNMIETSPHLIIFDDTPPDIPFVLDQGDYVNPSKGGINLLKFIIDGAVIDSESSVEEISYQLIEGSGTLSNDEDDWTFLDSSTLSRGKHQIVFEDSNRLNNGESVVLAVKAENGAGLSKIKYSNGIVIDIDKPSIAAITIYEGIEDQIVNYTSDDFLMVKADVSDYTSNVPKVIYQRGEYINGVWTNNWASNSSS